MKPILCTASVVRNLLNIEVGSWPAKAIDPSKPFQWQDRRIVKPQPNDVGFGKRSIVRPYCTGTEWPLAYYEMRGSCWNSSSPLIPPNKVGDALYVRETFFHEAASYDETLGGGPYHGGGTYYRADYDASRKPDMPPWKPSIHMPRELSRIHLEVMRVRVEHACDISENDAAAEGCGFSYYKESDSQPDPGESRSKSVMRPTRKMAFRALWERLYGPDAWEKWVWVFDLKRIK